MINHISDEDLRLEHLPTPGARIEALIDFAHTYNAYDILGSFERVSEAHERVMQREGITLGRPGSLVDLRAALFFVERSAYHQGWVDHFDEAQMRALIEAIRLVLFGRGQVPPNAPGYWSSTSPGVEEERALTDTERLHQGLTAFPTPPTSWDTYIESDDLTSEQVPGQNPTMNEVMVFAHTFDPYLYYGDDYETAVMIDDFVNEGGMRDRLVDLRTALFWYARRYQELGVADEATELRLRELTELIRLRVLLREHGLDQEPDWD